MPGRHYFYHLKFELYDTGTPFSSKGEERASLSGRQTTKKSIRPPPPGTDIFTSNFPVHQRPSIEEQSWRKIRASGEASGTVSESQFEVISKTTSRIIDCGPLHAHAPVSRGTAPASFHESQGELQKHSDRHTAKVAVRDWRFGPVRIESLDMGPLRDRASSASIMAGFSNGTVEDAARSGKGSINAGPRSHTTKARFEQLDRDPTDGTGLKNTELGWGIVHLYRDGEETPGLGITPRTSQSPGSAQKDAVSPKQTAGTTGQEPEEVLDTTILCIPAVPSYMTPNDFLGWVGEKTREEVSHFRMVMTGRMNRYLVLMKFRDGDVAKKWRQDWDGRVFGGLEPENCHVMFVKSIVFQTPSDQGSFPDTSQDPFTPSLGVTSEPSMGASLALKPLPPPTPSLIELPTCPVCLERMDDTTGLLTILCQHVFHCACLTKWRGSGCPVCRHTQPQPSLTQPFGTSASDLCRVCDCSEDLWICLICGHVGCGRYKGGHAKEHWKETAHSYALEIETQHVWDYAADLWVHRLIQNKGDGKLVELPSNSRPSNGFGGSREDREDEEDVEMVPRVKLENIGMEYTSLLTSQLESQRAYYEDIVKKAVSKASAASKAAEDAVTKAEDAISALKQLTIENAKLRGEFIPDLEKEAERMRIKAEKSGDLARAMTKSWQEEKKVGEGLMERIKHINEGMAGLSGELTKVKAECEDLREQNRDLGFFISGQQKLKEMEGQLGDEVTEGTVSLPERKDKDVKAKGRGKGRGKQV